MIGNQGCLSSASLHWGHNPSYILLGRLGKHMNRWGRDSSSGDLPALPPAKTMAKTYKNLWPQITSFENLHLAYMKARRNKRFKPDVLRFSANLEENLCGIQQSLLDKSYRTSPYYAFYVYEPKKRQVAALPFRDRVVHHGLCNIIEPIWEARFIHDNYACRADKGTHAGADRVTKFLQRAQHIWPEVYVLKFDIRSYFPSVDHAILLELLSRRIACGDTTWLIEKIIESWPANGGNKGIPIGNLTSQFFANVYLHELDKFAKQMLQAKFYIRYMDDGVIVHGDRTWLHEIREYIREFLTDTLKLQLNSKTNIFPAAQGINFLGYRIWPTHRLLRKDSAKRMQRKLKKFEQEYTAGDIALDKIHASIMSWIGHTQHAECYQLRKRLFGEFILRQHNPPSN